MYKISTGLAHTISHTTLHSLGLFSAQLKLLWLAGDPVTFKGATTATLHFVAIRQNTNLLETN